MNKMMFTAAAALSLDMPRAVHATPRADISDPKALIGQLQAAFEEFKATNDASLAAKVDDAVVTAKLDAINADLNKLTKALDDQAAILASNKLNGGVIGDIPASDPEYVVAFKAHLRSGEVQAAMTKGVDADGGYLAPIEWDRTITSKVKRVSPIRENSRVISISTAGFKKNFSDRAIGSGWVGETAARPATTTPAIGQLDFVPGEIYANPGISQQLLDDAAVDLEVWLSDEVDGEFAKQENIAFLSGNGTNKPYGILTFVTGAANAARHPWGAIAVVNSGHATQVTADALISLIYSLPGEFRGNAKLYTNQQTLAAFRKLKDGQGNYLWQPAFALGQPSTLAAAPVVEVPDMPDIAAAAIAALYGDMEQTYLVVDRVGIRVLRDPFTNKPFVHFYTTKRVGGGVQNPEPMRALQIAA
ncbi:MAG TPA: phage major capsid protein [Allosphingosinicella sp.]|nr:phage major capsid protein [Allosphingosinicella sp.]